MFFKITCTSMPLPQEFTIECVTLKAPVTGAGVGVGVGAGVGEGFGVGVGVGAGVGVGDGAGVGVGAVEPLGRTERFCRAVALPPG